MLPYTKYLHDFFPVFRFHSTTVEVVGRSFAMSVQTTKCLCLPLPNRYACVMAARLCSCSDTQPITNYKQTNGSVSCCVSHSWCLLDNSYILLHILWRCSVWTAFSSTLCTVQLQVVLSSFVDHLSFLLQHIKVVKPMDTITK